MELVFPEGVQPVMPGGQFSDHGIDGVDVAGTVAVL
jgi:hypothetical protein